MYVILSGCLPFHGQNTPEVYRKIKAGDLSFDKYKEFKTVLPSAKDLISRLLTVDKSQRLTCAEALQHRWFADVDAEGDE